MMHPDAIRRLLHRDPLYEAEKITGKSYKEDDFTNTLGMLDFFTHNQHKEKVLREVGDTYFNASLEEYLNVVQDIGFTTSLKIPFEDTGSSTNKKETQFFMWHDDYGILLIFDTWMWTTKNESTLNGGKFYYNWTPHNKEDFPWRILSSGRWITDDVWRGDHDCREAIRFKIQELLRYGDFVTPWVEPPPFPRLLHYGDTRKLREKYGDDYHTSEEYKKERERIERTRIQALPANVQEATGLEANMNS